MTREKTKEKTLKVDEPMDNRDVVVALTFFYGVDLFGELAGRHPISCKTEI